LLLITIQGDGKTIYKILKEGDFFGEFALLTSQRRAASVRTIGYCDTFVLSRADLHTVLKKFPVYKKKMRTLKQQINAMLIQTVANNANVSPATAPPSPEKNTATPTTVNNAQ
jgi:CRP-like cAMP-binding protein